MAFMTEAEVESVWLGWLHAHGYAIKQGDVIGPDGPSPERESYGDVFLSERLEAAVKRINPHVSKEAREDAIRQLTLRTVPGLVEENRRTHELLTEGCAVEYFDDQGVRKNALVSFVDFSNPDNNDWLAVQQFVVIEGKHERRVDVVLFINGIPVVVGELKRPGDSEAGLNTAYNQLQTYKDQIPSLFRTNAALVISDGLLARAGSLTADWERMQPWRSTDGQDLRSPGNMELQSLSDGLLEKSRFLDWLQNFTVFSNQEGLLVKKVAAYHQFYAVQKSLDSVMRASGPDGDRRGGVVWHTQGSGKSLSMVFFSGKIVKCPQMANPTIVVLTDRNDLDDQLFGTFSQGIKLLRQTPIQAESREDLRKLLDRPSGGIIFTTIQKFEETPGAVSERTNIVVLVDEAHRSQYGLEAIIDRETGEIGYGFAKHMRDAIPNATFLAFTGTPIEEHDTNTRKIFGGYVDIYDMNQSIEDGATVPLYYESRIISLEVDDGKLQDVDGEVKNLLKGKSQEEQDRYIARWSKIASVVGSETRVRALASDLVEHLEGRLDVIEGKAMAVCLTRSICVQLHDAIKDLRPHWYSDNDSEGAMKIVMSGSASDPSEWQEHITGVSRRKLLDKRAKNPEDPLKLVIVCDMWLTGFDARPMHTMYIDRPLKGHGLMQAVARVNRVFRDKPGGLIVDYYGIAQSLKEALLQYSEKDRDRTGIDTQVAIAVMRDKHNIVKTMFHGFDYLTALHGGPSDRLSLMAGAVNWIFEKRQQWVGQAKTKEGKKIAQRRFPDAVANLTKSYALASPSEEATMIREEVGLFQAIATAISKDNSTSPTWERRSDHAVQQLVSRAIVSTEIVDIFAADGIKSKDLDILSDGFLEEIQETDKPDLAAEALRRLIGGRIRSRHRTNIVQSRAFSDRLEDAIARYHSNAITAREVISELIALAEDIEKARKRGEEEGLTDDEVAFYDALAKNKSASQVMKDKQLKVIACELLRTLKGHAVVDWAKRTSVRARIKVQVKKILRKYKYPPDLEDEAVILVLQQAEAILGEWSEASKE